MGRLLETRTGNDLVVIMTYRYPELTKARPTTKKVSKQFSNIFFKHWVVPYRNPSTVLSGNGQQISSKLSKSLCFYLDIIKLRKASSSQHTNDQVRRYNKALVSRLWMYVVGNENNGEIFLQSLTYAYDDQIPRSTDETSFLIILSWHLPGPAAVAIPILQRSKADNGASPFILRRHIMAHLVTTETKRVEQGHGSKYAISVTVTKSSELYPSS